MIITAYRYLEGIGTAPHVVDDKVVVVTVNRFTHYQFVKAYSIKDLKEIWCTQLYAAGGTYCDLITAANTDAIIVLFHFSRIGTIDLDSGSLISTVNLVPKEELWRNKSTPCLIDEDTVFAPAGMYVSLIRIDKHGRLSLKKRTKCTDPPLYFYGRTAVKDQYVITYASNSNASYIVFLRAETGDLEKAIPIGPPHVRAYHALLPANAATNVIFAVNVNDELLAIDTIEKEVVSRIKIPSRHSLDLCTPLVIGNCIITGGYKKYM